VRENFSPPSGVKKFFLKGCLKRGFFKILWGPPPTKIAGLIIYRFGGNTPHSFCGDFLSEGGAPKNSG